MYASENWVSISISTRLWTNHRPLWPIPHVNIVKGNMVNEASAILFTIGWAELVSKIESNMPFCTCICPYAYALVKTRLKEPIESYWLSHTRILFMILQVRIGSYWLSPTKTLFRILQQPIGSYWLSPTKILQEPIGSYWLSPTNILFRILQEPIGSYWLSATNILFRIL